MATLTYTFEIKKVGDREALNALNDLDKKGRQIVENVAGATGRALGDVAVAYENGSKRVRAALEDIANGHRQNMKALDDEQRAQERASGKMESSTESLARRQGMATLTATRGMEQLIRTTQAGGSALDTIVAQTSQIAFGFGAAGPIVGAIGVATVAVVELFRKADEEAKKLVADLAKEFDKIAHMSVAAQGKEASQLYSGDPNAADPLKSASLRQLQAERDRYAAQITSGTSTFVGAYGVTTKSMTADAKASAEALASVNTEIERRRKLLGSLTSLSIPRAGTQQAAEELPGFIGDDKKAGDEAEKKATAIAKRAHDAAVKEFAKGVDERANALQTAAQQMAAKMIEHKAMTDQSLGGDMQSPKQMMDGLSVGIAESIKNDPFIKAKEAFDASVRGLAKHMHEVLSQTLGEGIAAGFEAAFSGKGIGNAFKALTATVLGGLGTFLEQLGAGMLLTGAWLTAFSEAVHSLNGPAAIAAGIGLIAAGAAMKAIASSFGGGGSAGGGGYGYGASMPAPSFLTYGVQAQSVPVTSTQAPEARQTINIGPIIGPDDPKAQRAIADMVNRAANRGLVQGL